MTATETTSIPVLLVRKRCSPFSFLRRGFRKPASCYRSDHFVKQENTGWDGGLTADKVTQKPALALRRFGQG